jgi:hypothetical protein
MAHNLFAGAIFGPVALKVIYRAFDDAWGRIERHFDDSPSARETARRQLADAILSVATDECRDAEALMNLGLQAMALHYRLTG